LKLQEALKLYGDFLQKVNAGDYQARLDVDTLALQEDLPRELIALGQNLNQTVESLVLALTDVQAVQQLYIREAWQSLLEGGTVPHGYQQQGAMIVPNETAWLAPMTQAVRTRQATVAGKGVAVPLDLRGYVIGALGVRREARDWNPEEVVLITAITDQLAQTIDNLRLLDETSRTAARERVTGEITARIREEVEIEAVLERALAELGRVLGADRATAHLGLGAQQEA